MSKKKIWFVCGSQHLYGPQVLEQVETDCRTMAQEIQASGELLLDLEYHTTAKSHGEVLELCQAANVDPNCVGLVLWMHTFSPAKMWIAGLKQLQKTMLHLHTQFNREIPWGEIDMNFMNLNQSAHGGREFGFIASRLGIERPVVVGHYLEARVLNELDEWCRAALAWSDWQGGAFAPLGDNMREVAVTEGNKVNAEIQLGYRVHGFGVGELVKVIDAHSPDGVEVKELLEVYRSSYQCDPNLFEGHNLAALQQAARIELGLRDFLEEGGFKGFTNTFEDLCGMAQLPGIASQRLMADGYGFGAEGDWKTSALVRALKVMGQGKAGGTSFMEDYTYHLIPGQERVLGAHMLEVCPSIAVSKPKLDIAVLTIGGKEPPARLIFDGRPGPALNAIMLDLGDRFRLLVNTVEAEAPPAEMPNQPVARAYWRPEPDLPTSAACWILAGGAHHTAYSQQVSASQLRTFANMAGVEMALIEESTTVDSFRNELRWNQIAWK